MFINKHNIIQVSLCVIYKPWVSIKVYSVIPFSRNSHNTETRYINDLFEMQINWLVSLWYESTPKGISEQTILTNPLSTCYRNKKFNNKKKRWKIAPYSFIIVWLRLILNYFIAHSRDKEFWKIFKEFCFLMRILVS